KMTNGVYASTALHIDMCSPIATSPTWSGLAVEQRAKLTVTGRYIFEWLIDELKPHVVIASVGWSHIDKWNTHFASGRSWERIMEHRTAAGGQALRAPLVVQANTIRSRSGHSHLFVNASAADKPFGRFTTGR